jgi:hypothetical protein
MEHLLKTKSPYNKPELKIKSTSIPDRDGTSFIDWCQDMAFEKALNAEIENWSYQIKMQVKDLYYSMSESKSKFRTPDELKSEIKKIVNNNM